MCDTSLHCSRVTNEELRGFDIVEFHAVDDEGDFAFDFHGVTFFGLQGRDRPLGSIVPETIQVVKGLFGEAAKESFPKPSQQ